MDQIKPFLAGIAGGTGSGKTTFAGAIVAALGGSMVSVIDADSYYRDLAHLPIENRNHVNFDHPDALDAALLAEHIEAVKGGRPFVKQLYDFTTHTWTDATVTVPPRPVVIVEGMLIFAIESVCRLFDLKIFMDTEKDIRLLRRILRDIEDRGRSIEMIARQYTQHVKPMHDQFVEPSKKMADIIIRQPGEEAAVIEKLRSIAGGGVKRET